MEFLAFAFRFRNFIVPNSVMFLSFGGDLFLVQLVNYYVDICCFGSVYDFFLTKSLSGIGNMCKFAAQIKLVLTK